jgi:hypothetical protein
MTTVEQAAVETVRPGDKITVSRSSVVVAEVNEYDDGTVVVVYFKHGIETYENKARDSSGRNQRSILALQSIAPLPRGATIVVERGNPAHAARLRRELDDGEQERAKVAGERWRRAQIADEERARARPLHVDPSRDETVAPRSYMCLCGHLVSGHALYRAAATPGTPYHWGRCLVDGCTCPGAENETGTLKERR